MSCPCTRGLPLVKDASTSTDRHVPATHTHTYTREWDRDQTCTLVSADSERKLPAAFPNLPKPWPKPQELLRAELTY